MINRLNGNYTIVANIVANNKELSLKAKGLYLFLCSKPENWKFSYAGLSSQLLESEKVLRPIVKELVEHKLLVRYSIKEANGAFNGYCWIINPNEEDLKNHIDPFIKNKAITDMVIPETGYTDIGTTEMGTPLKGEGLSNTKEVILNSSNSSSNNENLQKEENTTTTTTALKNEYNTPTIKRIEEVEVKFDNTNLTEEELEYANKWIYYLKTEKGKLIHDNLAYMIKSDIAKLKNKGYDVVATIKYSMGDNASNKKYSQLYEEERYLIKNKTSEKSIIKKSADYYNFI